MRYFHSLLFVAVATLAGAGLQAASNIAFRCQVTGVGNLKPAVSTSEVCDKFKLEIDKAMGVRTIIAEKKVKATSARWISVKVRLDRNDTMAASLTKYANGKTTKYPEIAIDVMDRLIDQRDIATLARETAKLVARK